MAAHQDRDFMRHAIKVMRDAGVVNKSGGAFGAVQQRPFAPHHLFQWRCGGDGCEGWPEVGVVVP